MAGLALILKQISLGGAEQRARLGAFQAVRDLGWLWAGGVVVLAIVGIVYQMRMTALTEAILMESYRNPGWPDTTSTPPA